jgi:hypothetical protein
VRGIRRLVLLVVATTVAFGFAVVRFESAAEDGCAQRAGTDPSYRVHLRKTAAAGGAFSMPAMPGMAGMDDMDGMGDMADPPPATYRLRVLRDGRAVTGARVCISAYMRGMSAMAVVGEAEERSPGTYEVPLDFAMGGEWSARVVVDERRGGPVAVAFDLVAG